MNGREEGVNMNHLKKRVLSIFLLISLLVLTACGNSKSTSSASESEKETTKIRIGTVTWIGYSGLWLAQDLGYFEEEGLEVDYSTIEDTAQIKSSLASNKIDAMATTIDSLPRSLTEGLALKAVFGLDQSQGADGIIAKKEIEDVSDLKGKEVAVEVGSVSEWFLANVLSDHGLSLDDVKVKEMTSSEAGAAFSSGKVDAAVTWEPWLSNAEASDFGKVLVSSADYPDLIVDVFAFGEKFIEDNPEAVKAFAKAYDRAVTYLNENPEEAYEVLGKRINGSADDAKAQLEGLHIMTIDDSKEFFGTTSDPGSALELAETAAGLWFEKGVMKEEADPEKVKGAIDPSFISEN